MLKPHITRRVFQKFGADVTSLHGIVLLVHLCTCFVKHLRLSHYRIYFIRLVSTVHRLEAQNITSRPINTTDEDIVQFGLIAQQHWKYIERNNILVKMWKWYTAMYHDPTKRTGAGSQNLAWNTSNTPTMGTAPRRTGKGARVLFLILLMALLRDF